MGISNFSTDALLCLSSTVPEKVPVCVGVKMILTVLVSFLAIVTISYKKDLKGLKGSYSGIRWVIIGFICFVSLLVILKKLSVS